MATLALSIEVTEKQLNALEEHAKEEGYETAAEYLEERARDSARWAVRDKLERANRKGNNLESNIAQLTETTTSLTKAVQALVELKTNY